MADTKISALAAGAAVSGTDIVPVTQGATTVKVTAANLLTYFNANCSIPLGSNVTGTLPATNGGTGQTSFVVGDLLYASSTTALSKLADVATGNALISGGIGVAPSWGKIGLTTHVLGTLPVVNGGTGTTTSTGTGNVVLSASPVLTGETTVAGLSTAIVAKSAAYTLTISDHTVYCDTTSAGFTITLPAASGNAGLEYDIKKVVAANTLTIDANASETIDGATTLVLTAQYDSVKIVCDGTKWHTVSRVNTAAGSGTVTSVAALTLGTTGTDLSSSVANGTTTPVITLNVPTASAANRGVLSAADWSTFNGKQAAISFGTGVLTFLGTPSSANLRAAITDETGTGELVFGTSPTLTTPNFSSIVNTGTLTLPTTTDTLVGRATTDTLTNKRITPRVSTVNAPASPQTPNSDNFDQYNFTNIAVALTIAADTGTPTVGQKLIIRLKDNGTARALTWNAIYRAIGVTLPTTTVVNKTTYVGFIYNATDLKWDAVAATTEV